jgi:phospholipid/cholesterol/gamma-HCH transport system permease protein
MLLAAIETLGARVSASALGGLRVLGLVWQLLAAMFDSSTWNRATGDTIVKQVYFTAVQILPTFLVYALVIAWVIIFITVKTAQDFGLLDFASEMAIRVVVLELLPLLTVLFVALRSGSAINTEVALMKVNNELDALEHCRVPPMRFEFLPRVVGGAISVVSMSVIAAFLALLLAYLTLFGFSGAGLSAFSQTIAKVFDAGVIIGWFAKCLFFGLAVTLFPIAAGLETPKKTFMIPVSVLKGMMRVFFAIVVIEVVSLVFNYI